MLLYLATGHRVIRVPRSFSLLATILTHDAGQSHVLLPTSAALDDGIRNQVRIHSRALHRTAVGFTRTLKTFGAEIPGFALD